MAKQEHKAPKSYLSYSYSLEENLALMKGHVAYELETHPKAKLHKGRALNRLAAAVRATRGKPQGELEALGTWSAWLIFADPDAAPNWEAALDVALSLQPDGQDQKAEDEWL